MKPKLNGILSYILFVALLTVNYLSTIAQDGSPIPPAPTNAIVKASSGVTTWTGYVIQEVPVVRYSGTGTNRFKSQWHTIQTNLVTETIHNGVTNVIIHEEGPVHGVVFDHVLALPYPPPIPGATNGRLYSNQFNTRTNR